MHSYNQPRPRRPYEKKTASKGGALIFGIGLGAAIITFFILVWITVPNLGTRLNYLPYYARTYYRKLVPHPEYLPTPVVANSTPVSLAANSEAPPEPLLIVEASPRPTATLSPVIASEAEENLLQPSPDLQPREPTAVGWPDQEENLLQPLPDLQPILDNIQLNGFMHQWQTWNNCGPATITTYTSFFGRTETQAEAAQFLKPNQDDKNVSPHELAAYARSTGLEAIVRLGGTIDQLRLFLSNNLPVLTETWLLHEGDGLGHYRLVMGYDDASGQLNTFDSLNGPNYNVSYDQFEADWRVFNRLYVVVYRPEQADLVASIIGDDMDDTAMYERLLDLARAEAQINPDDPIAFFNQGEVLTRLGRFQEAIAAFDRARQLGLHWRRLWYQFTPFEAYYAVGRYQDVLDLTEATLKGTGGLEEAYYYHGLALQATGQPGAIDDFEAALAYNPLFTPAAEALNQLNQ